MKENTSRHPLSLFRGAQYSVKLTDIDDLKPRKYRKQKGSEKKDPTLEKEEAEGQAYLA